MAVRSELGISPVLLQAVATLTSGGKDTPINSSQQAQTAATDPSRTTTTVKRLKMNSGKDPNDTASGIVTQLLQNLNEPIASLIPSPAGDPKVNSMAVSNSPLQTSPAAVDAASAEQAIITQAGLSMLGIGQEGDKLGANTGCSASTSATSFSSSQASVGMVISNEEMANFLLKEEPIEDSSQTLEAPSGGSQVPPVMNTDVSSMLSALASQHIQQSLMQKSNEQLVQTSTAPSSNGTALQTQLNNNLQNRDQMEVFTSNPSITAQTVPSLSKALVGGHSSESSRSQPHIIIYSYDGRELNIPVGSQSTELVVSESEPANGGSQQATTSYRVLVPSSTEVSSEAAKASPQTVHHPQVAMTTTSSSPASMPHSVPVTNADNTQEGMGQPCPVCGDKVSGYHYGIFTCESCKGFFKRTVQNKKAFVCPMKSDCDITSANRKKCPSCRFKRCLQMGMKLEAIRQDRTRGGRSSYEGCGGSYRKSRSSPMEKKMKRDSHQGSEVAGTSQEAEDGSKSHRNLVAILNHNAHKQPVPNPGAPVIPELLRDIMNLEPLLNDDDIPMDTITDGPFPEQALYNYMMKLAELRLYKLVRWARNLPQFGAISTDDQILLLQNCWSELIALSLCWRSIDTPHQLSISATHHITADWAKHLGVEDLVHRLLNITAHFRKLYLDQFEYVALKVLLLITPDVKGLKEPRKIREFQEKLQEALYVYTSSHFQNMKHKFGQLLLRLPELSRLSFLTKDILLKSLPDTIESCGLLVELLKGENKGDGEGAGSGGGLRL